MLKRDSVQKDKPLQRRPKSANPTAIRTHLPSQPDLDINPSPPIRLKKRLPSAIPKKTLFSKTSTDGLQSFQVPSRLLPRSIYQDKEALYEELLQCKQQVNVLSEENTRLRTRIAILEKDRKSLRTEITKSEVPSPGSDATKLRLLVRELVDQPMKPSPFKQLRLENQKLKRVLKITKTKQLEQEIAALYEELDRLKQLLQAQMSRNLMDLVAGENYKMIEERLVREQRENQRLRREVIKGGNVGEQRENNREGKEGKEQKESREQKEHGKQGARESRLKIKNFDKEIKTLKDQLQVLKNTDQYKANQQLKAQITKLERELMIQRTVVKGLTQKVNQQQIKLATLNPSKKDASIGRSPQPIKSQSPQPQQRTSQTNLLPPDSSQPLPQQLPPQPQPHIAPPLQSLGYFLTFKFAAQKYSPDDVVNIVMRSKPSELDNLLLGQPFFMNNEQHKHLFLQRVTKNSTRPVTPNTIVEVLCEIVPPYSQFENDEELYVGCSEIITVRYNELMAMMRGLQLQLQEKGKGKGKGEQGNMSAGLVAYEHLVQILARIGMDREQVRFVVGEISFFSDGLDSLNYFAMLDKFYIPTEAEGAEMGGIGQGFEPSYIEEVPEEFEDSSAPQAY